MKSSTLYLKEEKSSFDQPSIKLRHKILLQRDYHMTTKLKKNLLSFLNATSYRFSVCCELEYWYF